VGYKKGREMSWRSDYIAKFGQEAYDNILTRGSLWREQNPEKVHEYNRKGGKFYEKRYKYKQIGLQGERERIRKKHGNKWRPYKAIIAPNSQIHHQWRPETSEYDGVALVEKDQHQHGVIDVIEILEGKITLLSEEEVRRVEER
jgi:hypothetical protein